MTPETTTLWRPTGQAELDLVAASGWRAWPPRLPAQPIFYPVLSEVYATRIAREWNVPRQGVGHVTAFEVRKAFLDRYEPQQAGGRELLECWGLFPGSRSMRVEPEVVSGGAGGWSAYRCCLRTIRPCPEGPRQTRLSRTRIRETGPGLD